jgi:hypothetical protein
MYQHRAYRYDADYRVGRIAGTAAVGALQILGGSTLIGGAALEEGGSAGLATGIVAAQAAAGLYLVGNGSAAVGKAIVETVSLISESRAKQNGTSETGSSAGEAVHPTFEKGPHATTAIPASSKDQKFSAGERNEINAIGYDSGCHTCASPQPNVGRGSAILVQQRKIMAISATTL